MFGVFSDDCDVPRTTYRALGALQHRGQDAGGISTCGPRGVRTVRDLGLVRDIFDERLLKMLGTGHASVGHVRYSTTGENSIENVQPHCRNDHRQVALAHNGNLTNTDELRGLLAARFGVVFTSTSDSEIMAVLLSGREHGATMPDAVRRLMTMCDGAYSVAALANGELIGFRDPAGIRPLLLGTVAGGYCIASETCAFDEIGGRFLREVMPGELIHIGGHGLRSTQLVDSDRRAFCVFENVYFGRSDSLIDGLPLSAIRQRMGERLAVQAPAHADVVIAVPDSGVAAAVGYARVSKIPLRDALTRNAHVGRTFILPTQRSRDEVVRAKFHVDAESIRDQRVVLVDDSIVRGTTMRALVASLRERGAREIHIRVSSPPVKHPCGFGIDMSTYGELLAYTTGSSAMAAALGADSVEFLSLDNLYQAIGSPRRVHCDACLSGDYPNASATRFTRANDPEAPQDLSV